MCKMFMTCREIQSKLSHALIYMDEKSVQNDYFYTMTFLRPVGDALTSLLTFIQHNIIKILVE